MGRIRSVITILVLIALTSISAAAMVEVFRIGLPERPFRNPGEIIGWMTTHNFATAEPTVQRLLIYRVESDFNRDVDWGPLIDQLNEKQLQRFAENFSELMRVWFLGKVDGYFAVPDEQRNQYLNDEMATIFNWKVPYQDVLEVQNPDDPEAANKNRQKLGAFFRWEDQFAQWQQRSTPEEQNKMGQFIAAVTFRLLEYRKSGENWPSRGQGEVRRGPFADSTEDRPRRPGNRMFNDD